jgi:osmotically-inducible protein OsmY
MGTQTHRASEEQSAISLLLTPSSAPGEQVHPGCLLKTNPRTITMNKFTRISVLVTAVALTALAGCASTKNHEGTGQYIDDTAITTKVKAAIFNEPSLKSSEINVETFKGRVQLSGFVRSQANINEAVAVAQGVNGVTSVGNDMRLK